MNTTEVSPRATTATSAKMNTRILLILLWVFYTVNFMYCDSLSSLEPGVLAMTMTGYTADGTVKITEGFLLGTADNVRDSVLNDRPVLGIKASG